LLEQKTAKNSEKLQGRVRKFGRTFKKRRLRGRVHTEACGSRKERSLESE